MKILPLILTVFTVALPFTGSAQDAPPVKPAPQAARSVIIRGADTMAALVIKLAESFHKPSGPTLAVSGGGSGMGIVDLSAERADICMSARPLKPEEKKKIEAGGKVVTEIVVCYDALGICVHESCPLKAISMDQLREIWLNGGINAWKALGAEESGDEIALIGRQSHSGEYSAFMEMIRLPESPKRLVDGITKADSYASILESIAGMPNAMGYVRAGVQKDGVKLVPVIAKADGKPVSPTPATIAGGTYPLSRPLYFYTTSPDMPAVKEFLAFVKSDAGRKIIEQEGFTPPPAGSSPPGKGESKK